MQTQFTAAQREDPAIQASEAILRKCVHCGFCAATCPTYALLGDELDSPRGRIYLIKDMLESGRPATSEVVRHVDRCLSCLACMTTCPSGVHYQHLVDHARAHIEQTYRRPFTDRWLRRLLAAVMPYPARFRRLLALARLARPLAPVLPRRLRAALALVPRARPGLRSAAALASASVPSSAPASTSATAPASTSAAAPASTPASAADVPAAAARKPRARLAMLSGCVQSVLGADANAATLRVLERMDCEVVALDGCCGSLTHHLGRTAATRDFGARLIDRLGQTAAGAPFDALVVNASGCGTHLKDYGFVFAADPALAAGAARVGELARDVTEVVRSLGLPPVTRPGRLRVAYHSACSLQHGQRLHAPPRELLKAAGFDVLEIPEAHLCCGSAGTYNMLQPELAGRLAARKLAHIAALDADVVAAGNLGCLTQLALGSGIPVVHTIELLDWATGGPCPPGLADRTGAAAAAG